MSEEQINRLAGLLSTIFSGDATESMLDRMEWRARAILDDNGYAEIDVWDFPGSDPDEIREVLETGVPGLACGRGGAL